MANYPLPSIKSRHLDIIEKYGGKNAGKILAAIAAAQVAAPIAKASVEWLKRHEDYTIAVSGTDDIYPDLHEWVLARIPAEERKAMIVSTGEGFGRARFDSDGSPPPVRLRYDSSRVQAVEINGNKVIVEVGKDEKGWTSKDKIPNEWKRYLETITFTAETPAGRDAIIVMIEGLQKAKYAKDEAPPLLIPSRWGGSWIKRSDLPERTLDSVILKEGQAEKLVKDLEVFLASEEKYDRASQPWHRGYLFHGEPGSGKAQPLDAKVLTPTGWTEMGELCEHDYVIGADGRPTAITGIFDQGELPIYRLMMSDGSSVEATGDHLWQVQTHRQRAYDSPGRVLTTDEIREHLSAGAEREFYMPMVSPVQFDAAPLPLDPYLLGLLLGDGCFRSKVELCSGDKEILDAAEVAAGPEVTCTRWAAQRGSAVVMGFRKRTSTGRPGGQGLGPVASALSVLGLYGLLSVDKFIPPVYMHASVPQRIALLRGLMDSDGGAERTAAVFYSSSQRLTGDVAELVEQMGGTAYVSDRIPQYGPRSQRLSGKRAYRVSIRLPDAICPFRLTRKAVTWMSRVHGQPVRSIVSVQPTRMAQARCIAVAAQDNLYVTEHTIVTHNTSVARALANHFGMPMYYLPLADLEKDADLMSLVTDIGPKSMLLLEDVDVFHAATERNDEEGTTIAALLNALDGIWTPHGLITVMTTNNRDALDDALIRAGRVDVDMEFTSLDDNQAAILAEWITQKPCDHGAVDKFVGRSPAELIKALRQIELEEATCLVSAK